MAELETGRGDSDGSVGVQDILTGRVLNGPMFKRVAAVARLKKRDIKALDNMPHAYGQKPFKLDGRLDLDSTFWG